MKPKSGIIRFLNLIIWTAILKGMNSISWEMIGYKSEAEGLAGIALIVALSCLFRMFDYEEEKEEAKNEEGENTSN